MTLAELKFDLNWPMIHTMAKEFAIASEMCNGEVAGAAAYLAEAACDFDNAVFAEWAYGMLLQHIQEAPEAEREALLAAAATFIKEAQS